MATILAAVTNDARKYWPQFFGWLLGISTNNPSTPPNWNPLLRGFKVGEGGWVDPGTGPVPRTPDASLRRLDNNIQDIDCVVDTTRAPANQRYPSDSLANFYKAFVLSDFTYVAPSTIQMRCFLDFTEFNDDGYSNYPEIWEIGVFSDHPTVAGQKLMIAYGTFPKEIKDPTKQIEHYVQLVF